MKNTLSSKGRSSTKLEIVEFCDALAKRVGIFNWNYKGNPDFHGLQPVEAPEESKTNYRCDLDNLGN